jgi:hypothetical protein
MVLGRFIWHRRNNPPTRLRESEAGYPSGCPISNREIANQPNSVTNHSHHPDQLHSFKNRHRTPVPLTHIDTDTRANLDSF